MEAKAFDLYTILAITHRLPSDGSPYMEFLRWMTGTELSPALAIAVFADDCKEWLFEQHPQLKEIGERPTFTEGDYTAMDAWADELKTKYGASLPVAPLPPGRRERENPIEAVLDVVPPEKVWIINPERDA